MSKIFLKRQAIVLVCLFLFFLLFVFYRRRPAGTPFLFQTIEIVPGDRVLILAPHPDDEVLGCGGIIQEAKNKGVPFKIVFLTYGDNNQWSFLVYRKHPVVMPHAARDMGRVRRDEALTAGRVLGAEPEQLIFLGYPDFRTMGIWCSHWGLRPAEKSMLTETRAVPYEDAFRPGAPYKGEEILRDLKAVLRDFKPTKIFLSHPADHNGDHRALYLFTRVAIWDLENEMRPALYPYLVHFHRWPRPRGYHPDKEIVAPDVLKGDMAWQGIMLSGKEEVVNLQAIKKHRSQYVSSARYLLSFIRPNELFGDFPVVRLAGNAPRLPGVISSEHRDDPAYVPEELFGEERVSFVGIEERSVSLEAGRLVIRVTLSRPLTKEVGISVYVFGYRPGRPFQEMPKLHLELGLLRHGVFDQDIPLARDSVQVERTAKKITMRIPLGLLGDPQYVLTSAQTSLGVLPLDWVSWRIVELP